MKMSTLKWIIVSVIAAGAVVAAVVLAGVLERRSERAPEGAGTRTFTTVREEDAATAESPDYDDTETKVVVNINGKEYYKNENVTTLLLMGVDDEELVDTGTQRNDALADFLTLAVFDNENKSCTLLQINRNTMTDVPVLGATGEYLGVTNEQIALSHIYGSGMEDSCENTVEAVSRFLYSTPIDNYLSLTMGAIASLNDTVGGVTVTIEDDLTSVDESFVPGATVTLHGKQAESFVRARMGLADDSNPARQRRQRAYMIGLISKLREKVEEDSAFVMELYASVADYLVTDCDINELGTLSENLSSYALSGFVTPEGETRVREKTDYAEFYVDETALQDLIAELFYVPVPEATPEPAPTEEAAPTATP